jgi:hypothetical protein
VLLAAPLAVASWQLRLAAAGGDMEARSVWGVGARVVGTADLGAERDVALGPRFIELLSALPMSRSPVTESYNAFSYPLLEEFAAERQLGVAGWLAFFALASSLAWWSARDPARRRLIRQLSIYLAGVFAAYLFAIYRVYDTAPNGEAFSSFIRYVNTLLLPMLLISLAWFLPAPSGGPEAMERQRSGPALCVLLVALFAVEAPYAKPLVEAPPKHRFRQGVQPATRQIVGGLAAGSRLLVLGAPASRFERWMLAYELTPLRVTLRVEDVTRIEDDGSTGALADHDFVWFLRAPRSLDPEVAAALGAEAPNPHVVYRVDGAPAGARFAPELTLLPAR